MRFAAYLRQESVSVYGYYDHSKGNRVAELKDAIWIDAIYTKMSQDELEILQMQARRTG